MLNFLNNRFTNSSLKVKIELYLLPLFLLYLTYYFLFGSKNNNESKKLQSKINIQDYSNKVFKGSFLELFRNIEKYAKDENILIKSINENKNIIQIKGRANEYQILKLINNIENINNFTKIDSLIISNNEVSEIYFFDLKVNLNKFYIKKINKDINQTIIINKEEIEKSYKIQAIVSNYVFINKKWFKENEMIDDFKLIEINRNYVLLKNDEKELKLELLNEEYLKRIN
jgi:hypothetical protein